MIRLGDTVDVRYGQNISKMWLVKDLSLKRFFEEHNINRGYYKVLGFQQGKGWWSLNDGSLKEMRAFIEQYQVKEVAR